MTVYVITDTKTGRTVIVIIIIIIVINRDCAYLSSNYPIFLLLWQYAKKCNKN